VNDFAGLVAVVTGGASGIGAATAELLRARGARVAVLDLTAQPGGYQCDVTDTDSVTSTIQQIAGDLGGIDVLVNNAGVGATGDVANSSDADWHRVFDVNVFGAARATRAALPYLRQSPHAAIVNTSSIVALVGVPARVVYAASKGAVLAMTLAMAADHVGDAIRVNSVLPGTADTPWVARLVAGAGDASAAEALRRRQPMGRLVTAAEVANAIVYLASPAASSTTGTLLTVDGGMGGLRVPTA